MKRQYRCYPKLRFSKYTARKRRAADKKHFEWLDEMMIRFEGKSLKEITIALLNESRLAR